MKPKELRISFDETATEGVAMKAELKPCSTSHDIFFRSNDITLNKTTEALLSVGLLPAMKTGSTLVADGVISQKFFHAIDPICDFYRTLNPSLKRIKIENVTVEPKGPPKENRVGIFFSAGVDSFYTFLKHQEEITDLIFIHGFDFGLKSYSRREKMSKIIREIGSHFGKRVVEVETNLRSFVQQSFKKPDLRWVFAYGVVLASVGHLLFPFFRRIYIPATYTYANAGIYPLGSHPSLDPLWSTEALEFIHDGCEATRIEKVALISQSEMALKTLQVCRENTAVVNDMGPLKNTLFQTGTENATSVYNCGLCEKCIRTMISLHIVGALERCSTLPKKLDHKKISQSMIYKKEDGAFLEDNLKALENRPDDRELYNALFKVWKQAWWVRIPVKYPKLYHLYQIRWIYRILRRLGRLSNKFVGR
jgi:hypothetical protein